MLVALVVAVVLLGAPAAGFAANSSVAIVAPGAGYGSPEGSQPVRDVQRLLRRLGDAPGPVDGLYGPLTTEAVQRFQDAHALAVDGVVGPQTIGRLAAERGKLRKVKLERKSPARGTRAESVTERPSARPGGSAQPQRADPEPSTAVALPVAVAVGALALTLLLLVLWRVARRRRDGPRIQASTGPRLGLVCAALLAAFAVGAATGAVFATHATPDRSETPSAAATEPGIR